ncbi:hypothetical protein MN608_08579 [Microdochium nivale]|nr:hypothetical protein MN608_08579 [Microdochium nivale]
MRFNAVFLVLAATAQLTTAAPRPGNLVVPEARSLVVREAAPEAVSTDLALRQWDGKGAEAGYKFGAVACGVGSFICNKVGYTVAADTLQTGAWCCGGMAAAVTASQSPGWVSAWNAAASAIGTAARVVGGLPAAGYALVASCTATVCQMVRRGTGARALLTIEGRRAENFPDYTKTPGYELVVPQSLDLDAVLVSRLAKPESDDLIDLN